MSLFERTLNKVEDRRKRLLDGKNNCIPWGLPRFERVLPGIEQGKYYLISGASKSAKSQITDHLFVINPLEQIIEKNLNTKLKIFYFTLELSAEQKMLQIFSNILYKKEGIRISPTDLKSTRNILPDNIVDLIKKYEPYFKKIEECVVFVDSIRNATGIYKLVRDYALANGKIHYKNIEINGVLTEVEDYYEPNDPEEYVEIIIDHASLIDTEKHKGVQLELHQCISLLSSNYLIKLRNRFNYIPILVQQQALAGENIEHRKLNLLKPSPGNLGDNKLTIRDIDVAFGIFSPFKYELGEYLGYDIKKFKDNIRFLEVMVSREDGIGTICPLYFDGAVNYFKELPKPDDINEITKVYEFLKNVKK